MRERETERERERERETERERERERERDRGTQTQRHIARKNERSVSRIERARGRRRGSQEPVR